MKQSFILVTVFAVCMQFLPLVSFGCDDLVAAAEEEAPVTAPIVAAAVEMPEC